jgi:transposase
MYEGFTEAVRQELPKANIVIDHFHVVQHYSKAADQLRKRELKRLKTKLTEEEYRSLQGNMWAFRKKRDDLTRKERRVLRKLFRYSPDLKQAYEFREQLSAIFELDISKTDAKQKLRTWIECVEASDITCFNRFIKTLERWFDEITNFFMHRETSGFVEGFNNKIKVLKRRCYGIFNIQHLYQRIFLDLEGYRLFA